MTNLTSPVDCFHPSNALTYGSLAAGIGATAAAVHGSIGAAGALIALAALADTFDGKFANLFRRTAHMQAFGVQLDSLCDAVVFAVAPVVCAAAGTSSLSAAGRMVWWIAALLYVVCGLTRLGFYNLSHGETRGFIGLPAPVAALLWSSALLAGPDPKVIAGVFVIGGLLMVAPIRIRRPTHAGFVAFVLWPVALVIGHLAKFNH